MRGTGRKDKKRKIYIAWLGFSTQLQGRGLGAGSIIRVGSPPPMEVQGN